jgi:predicted dehydrogenase
LATKTMTIAMNGVTGRMGRNQHLTRSILAIRRQGGVTLPDGDVVWPEPILVGRDPSRLAALAKEAGVDNHSTDLASVLDDPAVDIYFDATATASRSVGVRAAIEAGKAIYCEKPLAPTAAEAAELAALAQAAGVKHGIVTDKLFLPGIRKLDRALQSGFFGRLLSVRFDFGYWVFEGDVEAPQRPSWNYRREDGGGMVLDMFPHWQYLVEGLFGEVHAVLCHAVTHVPQRVDEQGRPYAATADDAAYALMELDGGVVASFTCSWATRVRRDELLELHVDGTQGSAVAGLRACHLQPRAATPRATWNPDVTNPVDFRSTWVKASSVEVPEENAFKHQWEGFLRHVASDEPFEQTLESGARGALLVDRALRSSAERRWVDVPPRTAAGANAPGGGTVSGGGPAGAGDARAGEAGGDDLAGGGG